MMTLNPNQPTRNVLYTMQRHSMLLRRFRVPTSSKIWKIMEALVGHEKARDHMFNRGGDFCRGGSMLMSDACHVPWPPKYERKGFNF
jgi:hypothetical protein